MKADRGTTQNTVAASSTVLYLLVCGALASLPNGEADQGVHVSGTATLAAGVHGRHCQRICTLEDTKLLEEAFLQDPKALQSFISKIPVAFPARTWLQIGANTLDPQGASYQVEDPLLDYLPQYSHYRKVFVEPIPSLFKQLQKHTQTFENTQLVNAAIVPQATVGGLVTMFCPPEKNMVDWMVGICSLDKAVIQRALPGVIAREFVVEALTMDALFRTYSIKNVEVVMIDTEGYDVQILKMLPFHHPGFRPALVVFEHTEISPEEWESGKHFLRSNCYMLAYDRENTYGLRMLAAHA